MTTPTKRRLVAVTILALALVEPLTHLWIQYFPGEGYAPSGIHTGDSGHHLVAMRAFATDFHSPYVTCHAEAGPNDIRYFATPFFLMYAVLGVVGNALGFSMFLWLGIINGIGGALMLGAAYALLRAIVPRHAENAFFLFALSGGVGGILYILARLSGWFYAPGFEDQFYRFAVYDLIEGQHRAPLLLFPRLYYTLPLAAAYAGLTLITRAPKRMHLLAAIFLAIATFINLRVGPMALGVALLYLTLVSAIPSRERMRRAGYLTLGVGIGLFLATLVSHGNAQYYANVQRIGAQVTWLLPLLYSTIFLWPGIFFVAWTTVRHASRTVSILIAALSGYLLLFALLVIGYHLYYGNYLQGGDTNASVAVSNVALLGVVPAVLILTPTAQLLASRYCESSSNAVGAHQSCPDSHVALLAIWGLGFLALSVSAWGDGLWIALTPQRFLVLAALPLAALAAIGYDAMRPAFRRVGYATAVGFGSCSLAVAALAFQGPLGHTPGKAPFGWLHYERILAVDAELLHQIRGGTVAVPPWSPFAFSEVLAQKPEIHVFSGPGAMNLGAGAFHEIMADLEHFWSPDTPEAERRKIALKHCIDYVYCPVTTPPQEEVLPILDATPWLEIVAIEDDARLYRATL